MGAWIFPGGQGEPQEGLSGDPQDQFCSYYSHMWDDSKQDWNHRDPCL